MLKLEQLYSPFFPLLTDSIELAHQASVTEQPWPGRLARASILSTCVLIEAAANCCIADLDRRDAFGQEIDGLPALARFKEVDHLPALEKFKQIDRLPALTKLEVFLGLTEKGATIDRGDRCVQEVDELRQVRDSLVHPKQSINRFEPLPDAPHIGRRVEEEWPCLGMNQNPSQWKPADAVRAMKAATTFFDYFFVDNCRLDAKSVATLFLHDSRLDGRSIPQNASADAHSVASMYISLRPGIDRWGLSFAFLGIDKDGPQPLWFSPDPETKRTNS